MEYEKRNIEYGILNIGKRTSLHSTPHIPHSNRGFSLVEVILSSAVFALLVTALVGAYLYGQEATALAGNRARANMIAEEGLEAARNIRDPAYANLTDGTYGLTTASNQWNLSGSSDVTDIFTRQIVISTIDTKRKSITSNVTWQQNPQRAGLVSLITRLTNWIAIGIGNWASPLQVASIDVSGNQNGLKVQVKGNYAYMVRDGGTNFLIIDVTSPASPSIVGSLTLNGTLNNIFVSGSYAYVASSDNSEELQIINISTPSSPSVAGTFNNPGNSNALGVYVVGSTAYLALGGNDEFSIINVSTPSSPSLISTLNVTSDANELVVSGNYAYLASDNNSEELQVIDISTPASPSQVASLNLSGNSNADTIAISGSTLFIGQGSTLYTINVSTPTSPSVLGSISTSGTVSDIALNLGNGNTYVFIATTDNSLEFQVIDVSVLSTPVLLGSVNTAGNDNLNGIAYDVTLDRAFGVGDRNSEEFFVFAPQ
jgi:prepilin-type N-terminal cleavage/methylation domain-containing protein